MYTLYSMQRSGNCYKARLALAQLGISYDIVDLDILKGDTKTPDFLAMNPSGRVPVLEVAPGRYLSESNAILWYIAVGSQQWSYGIPVALVAVAGLALLFSPSAVQWLGQSDDD